MESKQILLILVLFILTFGCVSIAMIDTGINKTTINVNQLIASSIYSPFGKTATINIAASNSNISEKSKADFVCNGTSDDQVINSAINNLPTNGGTINLLAGTYYLSSAISLKSYVTLKGEGMEATTLFIPASTSINAIQMYNTTKNMVSDLEINGNRVNNNGTAPGADQIQNGVYLNNVTFSTIKNCYVHSAIFHGIFLFNNSSNNTVTNNVIIDNGFRPIHAHDFCCYNLYTNNYCSGNGAASGLYGPVYSGLFVIYNGNSHNRVIGNTIVNEIATCGMMISGGEGGSKNYPCENNTVIGNVIDQSGVSNKDAIDITTASTINNLVLERNVIRSTDHGIHVQSGALSSSTIANNIITCGERGIYIPLGGNRLTINGNNIYAPGEEPIYLVSVTKSKVSNNSLKSSSAWAAIKLVGVNYTDITGNSVYNAKYVVDEDSASNNNNIANNVGNTITANPYYNLAGTSDNVTNKISHV